MKTWNSILNEILATDHMIQMKVKLDEEREKYKIIPDSKNIFNSLLLCPYEKTRVVILGQDPYPDASHAHGLAFSSLSGQTPASLSNIFREIHDTLNEGESIGSFFRTNNLTCWAQQGVMLLNTILTVRAGEPNSHKDIGWSFFVDQVFKELNDHPNAIVFMLWGSQAKKYASKITNPRHLILEAAHPSPLSADKGFFGCGHFRQANVFLRKQFYDSLITGINLSIDRDRIKTKTEQFFKEQGIEISKGNIMHIYDTLFEDIGLFFDQLIPDLKNKHQIEWRTR